MKDELTPVDKWSGLDELGRTKGAWSRMISRCLDAEDELYVHYGNRGITVCERWMSFDNFLDDMDYCPEGCSLERDDNDGNYDPDNCRWIPWQRQMDNTRRTRWMSDLLNRRR